MIDYKNILKYTMCLCAMIALFYATKSYTAPVFVLIALGALFAHRLKLVVLCSLMFLFVVLISRFILGRQDIVMLSDRAWIVLSGILLPFFAQNRNSGIALPFAGLYAYFIYSFLPSSFGYCPRVSYYKLIFILVFLSSIVAMCKAMANTRGLPFAVRDFIWAICIVLLLGSLAVLPFPAIAYPLNSQWLFKEGMDVASVNAAMRETASDGGMLLFAGITLHSQMLAPMVGIVFAFLLCDMLFIEKKMCKWHIVFMGISVVFAYMTRSRTALVTIIAAIFSCSFIVFNGVRLPPRLVQRLKTALAVLCILGVMAGVVLELRSNLISSWLYKGVDKREDALVAMTASRMGAVEEMMNDFKKNPIIGCGFQVNRDSARFADQLLVFSAPVEKGVTPLVILSEGGIIGAMIFLGFLVSFFSACLKRKYYSTLVMLTSFLAVNLGEGILFSPGGVGGFIWGIVLLGGLSIDFCRREIDFADMSFYGNYAYRLDR